MEPDASFVAADAYDQFVGRYAPQLAQELVAFAGVEAGMRALDVGCGPGGLTAVLADRLGAENVCGVEPSEPFAEACRARVPGVTVHVGAAELLPFDANSFDVALSQLVVNFMSDPLGGVREMARVTKPGGVVASCVWDYGGEMTMLRAFWDAAREIGAPGAAEADEANFAWCRDGELGELWRQAGLSDVRNVGARRQRPLRGLRRALGTVPARHRARRFLHRRARSRPPAGAPRRIS